MNDTKDDIDIIVEKELSKVEKELSRGIDISIINLVDSLIEKAYKSGASDIHIDPRNKEVRVRLRIDGVLQDTYVFPKNIHSEVISRIKVLARLRTDEHQATQDGRFRHIFSDNEFIDMRVDRKSTRLNSSHSSISYAFFCLKKQKYRLAYLCWLSRSSSRRSQRRCF